jgi:N-acetyl sugar amidotransferase
MDTSDENIKFNEFGVCNHCLRYDELLSSRVVMECNSERSITDLILKIKESGTGRKYDCIIGVSGGVDSTYVSYLVKEYGLRPLAIHFDNGWNSELAVSNIEKVLDILDIELMTYVIDWPTFRDLQISFLKASTPDMEIPTDHAINALLFIEANKRNIKYVINGMNFASESMSVESWAYGHSDWKYIRSIHRIFGKRKLKNYPKYNFISLFYWTFIKRVKVISILNYLKYDKSNAIKLIEDKLRWVNYGGKHYESVYTRFIQGYILPYKFNIDKRIGHFSDLIRSNQLSREEAIENLKNIDYDPSLMKQDREFFLKKLGFTESDFQQILDSPIKSYKDYPNSRNMIFRLKKLVNWLRYNNFYSK